MNSSTPLLRWSHFVQGGPATLQTLWLCVESDQAVLLVCNLQDASAGGENTLQEGCFSPSSRFFSTSSGRRKLHVESCGKDFQAKRAMREIQTCQMTAWTATVLGSLKKNYQLKTFPRPMSTYFAYASPPRHQDDLHLAWLCEKILERLRSQGCRT